MSGRTAREQGRASWAGATVCRLLGRLADGGNPATDNQFVRLHKP